MRSNSNIEAKNLREINKRTTNELNILKFSNRKFAETRYLSRLSLDTTDDNNKNMAQTRRASVVKTRRGYGNLKPKAANFPYNGRKNFIFPKIFSALL